MIPGLTEGRIVHYVLFPEGTGNQPQHRPAIVVKDWHEASGCCNLQVFLDGTNDRVTPEPAYPHPTDKEIGQGVAWRTSVVYSADPKPGTWHWPEKFDLGHVAGEVVGQNAPA